MFKISFGYEIFLDFFGLTMPDILTSVAEESIKLENWMPCYVTLSSWRTGRKLIFGKQQLRGQDKHTEDCCCDPAAKNMDRAVLIVILFTQLWYGLLFWVTTTIQNVTAM